MTLNEQPDIQSNQNFDNKSFLEVYKMLQKGEMTADDLEKKLDNMENVLDDLLSQIDQSNQNDGQLQDLEKTTK